MAKQCCGKTLLKNQCKAQVGVCWDPSDVSKQMNRMCSRKCKIGMYCQQHHNMYVVEGQRQTKYTLIRSNQP